MNVIENYPTIFIETNIGIKIRKNIVCKTRQGKSQYLSIKHSINKLIR